MTRAVPHSSNDSHRRWVQLRLNVAAGGLARLITGVCALLQVAILVRILGVDGYGFWIALLAVASFVTYFDAGVGITIETSLAEAYARGDDRRLRAICSSGGLTLAAIGGLYGVAGAAVLPWIDWTTFVGIAPDSGIPTRAAAFLVFGLAALGVPFNLAPRLAGALQLGRLNAAWTAAGSLGALGLAALAAWQDWSWLGLVTLLSLLPILQNAGLLLTLGRRLGWSLRWTPPLPGREWRARLAGGLPLSLHQLGQGLLQLAPPLTIGAVGGPAAVTAFNLIQRLATPLLQGQALLMTPLWPTYVEAHARGDTTWLSRMLRLSVVSTLAAVAMLAALVAWRDPILTRWVGPSIVLPTAGFAWMAGLWFALNLCSQPLYHFLVGVGRWRVVGLSSVAGHGLALVAIVGAALTGTAPAVQLALASACVATLWIPGLAWAVWQSTRHTESLSPA